MRVLVTGGGGVLGAATVRALLARGDTAIAFDTALGHLMDAGPPQYLIRVPGDITDMANLAQAVLVHKPEAVIHCAAVVGVLSSLGSPTTIVRVNIEGSLNVFEAMRLGGVKRCIHISSEEAYGAFRADKIDETHPLDPVLPYGICKAAVEHLGRSYRDLHGLEVVNLRTSWVYGPGLPRERIPKNLVDAALAGRRLHIPMVDGHAYCAHQCAARVLGRVRHRDRPRRAPGRGADRARAGRPTFRSTRADP